MGNSKPFSCKLPIASVNNITTFKKQYVQYILILFSTWPSVQLHVLEPEKQQRVLQVQSYPGTCSKIVAPVGKQIPQKTLVFHFRYM